MQRNFPSDLSLKVGNIVDINSAGKLVLAATNGIGIVADGINTGGVYTVNIDIVEGGYTGTLNVGDGVEISNGAFKVSTSPAFRCISKDTNIAQCARFLASSGGGGGGTIPVASDTVLGGVKIPTRDNPPLVMFGDNLMINQASPDQAGVIMLGNNLQASPDGSVSVKLGENVEPDMDGAISVPNATNAGRKGVIAVDGKSIKINPDTGLASAADYVIHTYPFDTDNPIFVGTKTIKLATTNNHHILGFTFESIAQGYTKGDNIQLYLGTHIPREIFLGIDGSTIMMPVFHVYNPFFPATPAFTGTVMMQWDTNTDEASVYLSMDCALTNFNFSLTGMCFNPLIYV